MLQFLSVVAALLGVMTMFLTLNEERLMQEPFHESAMLGEPMRAHLATTLFFSTRLIFFPPAFAAAAHAGELDDGAIMPLSRKRVSEIERADAGENNARARARARFACSILNRVVGNAQCDSRRI